MGRQGDNETGRTNPRQKAETVLEIATKYEKYVIEGIDGGAVADYLQLKLRHRRNLRNPRLTRVSTFRPCQFSDIPLSYIVHRTSYMDLFPASLAAPCLLVPRSLNPSIPAQ